MGCGMLDVGCGMWDVGCGIRDTGYIRGMRCIWMGGMSIFPASLVNILFIVYASMVTT